MRSAGNMLVRLLGFHCDILVVTGGLVVWTLPSMQKVVGLIPAQINSLIFYVGLLLCGSPFMLSKFNCNIWDCKLFLSCSYAWMVWYQPYFRKYVIFPILQLLHSEVQKILCFTSLCQTCPCFKCTTMHFMSTLNVCMISEALN